MKGRTTLWLVLGTVLVAALVRLPLLTRQGLWVDEVFSLALATGHSLEHPAADADPRLGDFVEGEAPRSAQEWRSYLSHDDPPTGPGRVVRAVLLSDTSPPLYYLGLWAWTRALGTSDAALRGFSLFCALLCLPFALRLARWAGGRNAVLPAGVLFALAPLSIYYGTEGRMYSLLWLWTLAFVWTSVVLRVRGPAPLPVAAWVVTAAGGFLTHYFFVFVWGAVLLLLFLRPGRLGRGPLLFGVAVTVAVILPWYAQLGESLGRWRVTGEWLTWEPTDFRRGAAALELFLSLFTGSSINLWGEDLPSRAASVALFGLFAVLWIVRWKARAFNSRLLYLWLWLAATWAGPLVFDLARGTYTVAVPRYALDGLPAVLLLAAVAAGCLPALLRTALLVALYAAWQPHLDMLYEKATRSWCPLREMAQAASAHTEPADLVLVHSIPSGILGVARYFEGSSELAAWVDQLEGRAVPGSFLSLARGKPAVWLVRIHEVGARARVEDWLRANAEAGEPQKIESGTLTRFLPRDGSAF